jgi:hypothetical protein
MNNRYSKLDIEKFTLHVLEYAEGYNYLLENKRHELLAVLDAVRGDKKAFDYLMKSKEFVLAAFCNAIWDDSTAFKMLMDNKFYEWAAAANIINGDEKAIHVLNESGNSHYVALALAIQKRIREDNDRNSNIFNMMNFFKR